MRFIGFVSALLLLGFCDAHRASAAFTSGNDLLGFCTSTEASEVGVCVGYVAGVVGSLEAGSIVAGRQACIPNAVAAEVPADVAISYIRTNVAYRHLSAAVLVATALSRAYPCPAR